MNINESESIRTLEESLRTVISFALEIKYGNNWLDKLKIDKKKIEDWKSKREEERKRFRNNILENRLLYYSDFYDLKTIILKHWDDCFSEVFKEKKEFEVLFDIVGGFRTNIAHHRLLYNHQKVLLKGIEERILFQIADYRADRDNEDSYFPKITNVLINGYDITDISQSLKLHEKKYHVGDKIRVAIKAIYPPDVKIKYAIFIDGDGVLSDKFYSDKNEVEFILKRKHIPSIKIKAIIKSTEDYHRLNEYDGLWEQYIHVLPNK